jgi:hypothetical protein
MYMLVESMAISIRNMCVLHRIIHAVCLAHYPTVVSVGSLHKAGVIII